jgi:4-hydroxy-tetrahydrodipicolinate synthase
MFGGSMVALVTPMRENGSIDEAAVSRLVKFHGDNGTDALVVAGTTGESATLEDGEYQALLEQVVAEAGDSMPVFAGAGSCSTAKALKLVKLAAKAGVEGTLVVTPYYNRPMQEGLYAHYQALAAACDLPLILYNVPTRTACDLLPETVERLAKIDNIIGIKEACPDHRRIRELRERIGEGFGIFSGDDGTAMAAMLDGADGVVSVAANVAPDWTAALCRAARAGDAEEAWQWDAKLSPFYQALAQETNPIPVKWALYRMGLIGPTLRLPLQPLAEVHRGTFDAIMREAGMLAV